MKKALAYGSVLATAAGIALLYKFSSSIRFQRFKILTKEALLFILHEIRSEYTQKFAVPLRMNRKKRRGLHRGGREYRNLVKELKEQSKEYIQKSVEEVLSRYKLTEDVLSESYQHFEQDLEIKAALSKLCSVKTSRVPTGVYEKLESVLETYIARTEELNESNPNELNIQMKMLEDDIFQDFGCEPEEIEEAVKKDPKEYQNLMRIINELNEELLSKTNQEIFY